MSLVLLPFLKLVGLFRGQELQELRNERDAQLLADLKDTFPCFQFEKVGRAINCSSRLVVPTKHSSLQVTLKSYTRRLCMLFIL
jgi:hypothetical protein